MPSFLQEHCLQASRLIPPNICEEIIEIGKNTYTEYGQIGGSADGIEDHYTRKSGVAWLDRDAKLSDGLTIFDHITPHVRRINEEYFKFDLTFHETYQFTTYKYDPDRKEHYSWHCDGHHTPYTEEECKNDPLIDERLNTYRKLSYSVNLSHPDEYEGGHFEWTDPYGLNPQNMTPDNITFRAEQKAREQGSIIVFPSFVYHQVTPVIRGMRHSLVGWIAGPTFR
tara:strand:- start:376 stop:1050 length:675 start_codon:yes stop_codon:yes gene_type:complete